MCAPKAKTISYATAMPSETAPRLVAGFLDRHGAGLQDLCARFPEPALQRHAAVRQAVATTPADPARLARTLEDLAETLERAHGGADAATPAGLSPRADLDAAIRWHVARLVDLSAFCRRF